MIEEYDKAFLTDLLHKHDVEVEVNFSDDGEAVRISMGGNKAVVKKAELYNIIWMMADPQTQEKMMPVRQTLVRKIVKQHRIMAKKDIKKGEYVVAKCETNIPVEVFEGLKGMMPKIKEHVQNRGLPIIRAK